MDDRQIFGVDFNNGDVRFLVRADHLSRKFAAIFQFYVDFIGGLDHVEIRKNIAIRPDDESGSFALDRLKISLVPARIAFVWRALEKQILERGSFGIVLF